MLADADPTPRLPRSAGEKRTLWVASLLMLGLFAADLARTPSTGKLGVLFVLLAWGPLLILHELGHAGAAWLVGWRVREIVIGFGRELGRFRLGETVVRLRLAPVEGYVVPSPEDLRWPRAKSAFIFAAGPGIEILLIVGLWWSTGDRLLARGADVDVLWRQGVAVAAAIGVFFNLLPLPIGAGVTDGLGILLSFVLPESHFRSRLLDPAIDEATRQLLLEDYDGALSTLDAARSRYGDRPAVLALLAVAQAGLGHQDLATSTLDEAVGPAEGGNGDRGADRTLSARAWVSLFAPEPDHLPFARRAAAEGVRGAPHDVSSRLVHGRVLLALDRELEAFAELMSAYKLARTREEENVCLAWLAIASRRALRAGAPAREGPPYIGADYPLRFAGAVERGNLGPTLRSALDAALAASPGLESFDMEGSNG